MNKLVNFQVTVELSDETKEKLDIIGAALEALVNDQGFDCKTKTTPQAEELTKPEEKAQETETEAPPWGDEAPHQPEPVAAVDRAAVQKKVVELAAAGKKTEVRDLVREYAEKVSRIAEDKLAEVMERLIALEG